MDVEQVKKQIRRVFISFVAANLLLILVYVIFMGGIPSRHDAASRKMLFTGLQLVLVILHFIWYRRVIKGVK